MTLWAQPFEPTPAKLAFVLDHVILHRPWFDDFVWDAGDDTKRVAAMQYIARALGSGRVLEVWRDDALVGILLIEVVAAKTDASCHFIFFDNQLADKRALCHAAMSWAFDRLDVHRLSTEVPEFAAILAKFARKKLGFRYEAEGAPANLDMDAAFAASRKREAMRYKGRWEDVLLLSITREEFVERSQSKSSAFGSASTHTTGYGFAVGVPQIASANTWQPYADVRSQQASRQHVQPTLDRHESVGSSRWSR